MAFCIHVFHNIFTHRNIHTYMYYSPGRGIRSTPCAAQVPVNYTRNAPHKHHLEPGMYVCIYIYIYTCTILSVCVCKCPSIIHEMLLTSTTVSQVCMHAYIYNHVCMCRLIMHDDHFTLIQICLCLYLYRAHKCQSITHVQPPKPP